MEYSKLSASSCLIMAATQVILNLIELKFFRVNPSLKLHILVYSNDSAIWHVLPDIRHVKVNNGRKYALLNLINLKFFRPFPSLKQHILFYSNGRSIGISHGLPDINHIKVNYAW